MNADLYARGPIFLILKYTTLQPACLVGNSAIHKQRGKHKLRRTGHYSSLGFAPARLFWSAAHLAQMECRLLYINKLDTFNRP